MGTPAPGLGSQGREPPGARELIGLRPDPWRRHGRQALPAWYRGVWCPPLRPLKKLAVLEFSVCKAFPSRLKLAKVGVPGSPPAQPG